MKTLSVLVVLLMCSLAMAKPSGNMSKTTRFYGPGGYYGSARVYDYGNVKRSYFYDSKGVYKGQSVERK